MPLLAATLGMTALQAYGSLRAASAQRRQLREQARQERLRVQELRARSEFNIEQMTREGHFAQRQAQAAISSSGAAMGGETSLAHMTNIANQIVKEAGIVRRETDFAVRAGLSQAAAMSQQAKGGFLDTVNILAGAGIQSANAWQGRPQQGQPTPRQSARFQRQSGDWTRPSLLDIGSN